MASLVRASEAENRGAKRLSACKCPETTAGGRVERRPKRMSVN
jgi:hypothetical protein